MQSTDSGSLESRDAAIFPIKGNVASSKVEDHLLRHSLEFKVTDSAGAPGIKEGDIVLASGWISPALAHKGLPLILSLKREAEGLDIATALIDVASPDNGPLSYLASGAIAGLTRQAAGQIFKHFGGRALQIIDADPRKIAEVPGLNDTAKRRVGSLWAEHRANCDAVIEAMSLGLSPTTARRAVDHFGADTAVKLYGNPYLLSYVQGYGYMRADKFAQARGIERDSASRIQAAQWYSLNAAATEGHTFLPMRELAKRVTKLTGLDETRVSQVQPPDGVIVTPNQNAYLNTLYEAERYVAQRLRAMSYERPRWSIPASTISQQLTAMLTISPEQRQAVLDILTGPRVAAIMGLPGTGKTTLIRSILSILGAAKLHCQLAAPTGKAAARITEQTGHPSQTIHRMLGITRAGAMRNTLETDCVIIDESSMVDLVLMRQILQATPDGTLLILVGDSNQLPAVGPGNILREINERGICNLVYLHQIHRQGERSQIIRLAEAIHRKTIPWDIFGAHECVFVQEEEAPRVREKVVELVANNQNYRPNEIQVLAPMRRAAMGVDQLNQALKAKVRDFNIALLKEKGFSPAPFTGRKTHDFDLGDRVIQRANNYRKAVYNGEVGYVVQLEEDGLAVAFDDGRVVEYEGHELYQLDLAFATTVHASQGSEYKCVVIPVHTSHAIMLFQSLLYTAVTRAREKVILVGTMKAIQMAARIQRQGARYSNLSEIGV